MQVEAYASHSRIHPGESFQVAVVATIKEGYHINGHKPLDRFLMPTLVTFDEREEIVFGPVAYPQPKLKTFSFSTNKVSAYEGKIAIFAQAEIGKDVTVENMRVSGAFAYQACNERSCFMPKTVRFEIPLEIVGADQPAKLTNKDIFRREVSLTTDEQRAKQVIEKGLPHALVAFFLFGLALNLTPCVYPVIPITVSFFVSQSDRKKRAVFVLASYYVLGIAIVFSSLGLVSGLAGRQWGFLFQNPWFVICIATIILSMAASMFGAFEISVPSSFMTTLSKSRRGAIGSFVMGLTVGVVIAPCAAGIIIGLVGIVAKLGIVARGALLFFVMGLGLGLPYLLLANFSGLLKRLPKSGMWMVWIRKLFGLLLIGVAIYFLVPQARQTTDQQGFYLGVLAIFGGLLLGFLDHGEGYTRSFKTIRGILGALVILSGVFLVNAALQPETPAIDWVSYRDQSIEELQKNNRPLLIDFYADWCSACKQLDQRTFRDRKVVEKSQEFVAVRVDCTAPDSECRTLIERFQVSGLPTVVFVSSKGEEIRDLRGVGFLGPLEMLKKMEDAVAR